MTSGYNMDVLVFDGMMIRKRDKPITEELLGGLGGNVFEKTRYEMEFVENVFRYNHRYIQMNMRMQKQILKIPYPTIFMKSWINDENIRRCKSLVLITNELPPLKNDSSDYNRQLGFEDDKNLLPNNFNMEINEYI